MTNLLKINMINKCSEINIIYILLIYMIGKFLRKYLCFCITIYEEKKTRKIYKECFTEDYEEDI